MYRKILVGYDDTDHAKDALALGKQLTGATGAQLVVAGGGSQRWAGRASVKKLAASEKCTANPPSARSRSPNQRGRPSCLDPLYGR